MGDEQTQPGTEVERLEREVAQQYWELRAKLENLDRLRAQARARHKTPEERRRAFRVIQGGAAIAGAAVAVGAALKRPAVALASGTTAAGVGAVAMFMLQPMPHATRVDPPVHPPPITSTPYPPARDDERTRVVAELVEPEATQTRPAAPAERPAVSPPPIQGGAAEPPSAASPTPTPTPSPTPTATATVTAPPLVEIEVNADGDEACVDSGLVGLELAVCLEGVR